MEYPVIQDIDISGLILDDYSLSSVSIGAASSSSRLEEFDRELTSILVQMKTVPSENNHKPDVQRLYNWLKSPGGSADELSNIMGPLKENVCQIMTNLFENCIHYFCDSDIGYLMDIGHLFDFMTVRFPVLEDLWVTIEQFGLRVAEKLRQHQLKRQQILLHDKSFEYTMGLKTLAHPRELLSIIALLKYVRKQDRIEKVSKGLHFLVKVFKVSLQEPDLLDITTECIMDVMESLFKEEDIEFGLYDVEYCIYDVDILLEEFCKVTGGDCTADKTPVGMEIIRRYKRRICKLRTPITDEILDDAPMIYKIIYNNEY